MAKRKKKGGGRKRKYISIISLAAIAAAAVDLGLLAPADIPASANRIRGAVGTATGQPQGAMRAALIGIGVPLVMREVNTMMPGMRISFGRNGIKL